MGQKAPSAIRCIKTQTINFIHVDIFASQKALGLGLCC